MRKPVAMTRARSVLTMFAQRMQNVDSMQLYKVINERLDALHQCPEVDSPLKPSDEFEDILNIIGPEHRKWLVALWKQYGVTLEPLQTKSGEIVAEPIFWFRTDADIYACFANNPSQRIQQRLENSKIKLLGIGDELDEVKP